MGHLGVHTRLRADSKVVHHAVGSGEVFLTDGAQVIVRIHEPLVDDDPAAAGEHVPRAVGVVVEHGADGGFVRLANAGFGNADDAHDGILLCVPDLKAPGVLVFITLWGGKVKGMCVSLALNLEWLETV